MADTTISQRSAHDLILANATDFLNAGLEILFADGATARNIKIGVIAIQTAIELFAKYRLVKDYGLEAILQGGAPKGDLITATMKGQLRTIGYGKCLKKIEEDESFTDIEKELVERIQQLRNSLVHFAADIEIEDVRINIAWLLIRVLAMFAAGQERDQGEMQDYKRFLESDNFYFLTNYDPYRSEAVDSALDSLHGEHVFRCFLCDDHALSLRESDTYFCHCCGLTVDATSVAYADCSICGQHDVVFYDPLNTTRGLYRGRCLYCKKFVGVGRCAVCGETWSQKEDAPASECPVCAGEKS